MINKRRILIGGLMVLLPFLLAGISRRGEGGRNARSHMAVKEIGAASVKIGNYFVEAPYGIAIIVDDETAFLIDPVWDDPGLKSRYAARDAALMAPGTAAPDFSYVRAEFRQADATVRFSWGRSGAAGVIGIIETDRPTSLSLRLPKTWLQFHTIYKAAPDGIEGYGIAPRGAYIPFVFRTSPPPAQVRANWTPEAEVVLALEPRKPVRFAAGVGATPPLEGIEESLRAAAERYTARRPAAEGDWGDFLGAMGDVLNNARLYGSDNGRIAHACGRGWWLSHQSDFEGNADLYPYFLWDYFFHGLLAGFDDPGGGRDTVRAVLSFQTPAGFIPSFSHWGAENNTYVTLHRSMPPVGSLCVWKMHQRWPDKAFLAEVYPKLVRWHDWWPAARDGNRNGLLEWGSEQGWWQGAQFETGWDDNVHFEGTAMAGSAMNADAVDLNALWSMDAENLALIADALGKTGDAARFRAERDAMNERINKRLWNDELGIYCSRLWDVPLAAGPALLPQLAFKGGFKAEFFRDWILSGEAAGRNDVRLDFNWGESSPAGGIPAGRWAARWTGTFTPPASGLYRFIIDAVDGARLFVGGELLVDTWKGGMGEAASGDVRLEAGETRPVVVEYFRDKEPASLRLTVSPLSPGIPGSDWLTRLTPMNFYPLICGAPDAKRAERVLAWLYREDKFWLPWLVPTVAFDDPVWPTQHYWRGYVWPPANYLVWQGVRRYAAPERRAEFARRSVELFMRNWRDKRQSGENYRSTDGGVGAAPHYTWGTLLCLIGVEALADVRGDLKPEPAQGTGLKATIVMRRIPFGGKLYRIEARDGTVSAREEKSE